MGGPRGGGADPGTGQPRCDGPTDRLPAGDERPALRQHPDPAAGEGVGSRVDQSSVTPGGEHSAYTEGYSVGTYYREPEDVERHQTIYDRIQADALSTEASIQAIRDIRRKHR
ncbi:Scr1 family TA system antitoxin-like transcriptional regulator [Streptomyces sp. LE64]|uniref:Scr1 family TA system antitoxin-like transcriptional regulator n=1 Tax=Streptomyces sp. LE64 TaxID=3448653 RepID=UPI0040429910